MNDFKIDTIPDMRHYLKFFAIKKNKKRIDETNYTAFATGFYLW
jgi:hypothetical protein